MKINRDYMHIPSPRIGKYPVKIIYPLKLLGRNYLVSFPVTSADLSERISRYRNNVRSENGENEKEWRWRKWKIMEEVSFFLKTFQ